MATNDPFSSLRGRNAGAFFEPYARMVQCLCPRTRGIAIYDASGQVVWQRDPELTSGLTGQVHALLQDATDPEKNDQTGSLRMFQGTTPAYLLWLRDDRGIALGIAAITCKPPSMDDVPPLFPEEMGKTLRPALQCLSRELATLRLVPTSDQEQVNTRLRQAEWLVDKLVPAMQATASAEPLREVIARLVDQTDSALGAIIVPERSLRIVVESVGWEGEAVREALRRAHRQVLAWMQIERRPLILNQIGHAKEPGRYRVLAAPICERKDHADGYVVLLRSSLGSEFGAPEERLLERVAPLLQVLIARDYDSMTDLRSAAGLERSARNLFSGEAAAAATVIFADIAGLRDINARLGAATADRLIRRVARLLHSEELPADALRARLSGGHFACVLPRKGVEEAERIAAGLREAAAKIRVARESPEVMVQLRTGVAPLTPVIAGLRHALVAARAAAATGEPLAEVNPGTPIEVQAPSGKIRSTRQLVPLYLREALREGRLTLFGQPMRPVSDPRRPVRIELLPRILDEHSNLIVAADFLAAGPDAQAQNELDRWVMTAALEAVRRHFGPGTTSPVELSMNVSGASLGMSDFHEWAVRQLASPIVPAEQWLFEIAETTACRQQRELAQFARQMMTAGARIAIDDVGSAGIDMARLKSHCASTIKLGGSLIRDVASDARAQRLVEALAQWAGACRMDTVAEHVESEPVRERLAEFGIDYAQGFLIGKPQPLERVLSELIQSQPSLSKSAT